MLVKDRGLKGKIKNVQTEKFIYIIFVLSLCGILFALMAVSGIMWLVNPPKKEIDVNIVDVIFRIVSIFAYAVNLTFCIVFLVKFTQEKKEGDENYKEFESWAIASNEIDTKIQEALKNLVRYVDSEKPESKEFIASFNKLDHIIKESNKTNLKLSWKFMKDGNPFEETIKKIYEGIEDES